VRLGRSSRPLLYPRALLPTDHRYGISTEFVPVPHLLLTHSTMEGQHGRYASEQVTLDIRIRLEELVTRREAMTHENAVRSVAGRVPVFDCRDFMGVSRELRVLGELLRRVSTGEQPPRGPG